MSKTKISCFTLLLAVGICLRIQVFGQAQTRADVVCRTFNKTYKGLLSHPKCDMFYNCHLGTGSQHTCPADLLYSDTLGWCEWQENVVCGTRIEPGGVQTEPPPQSYNCPVRDGDYADVTDCSAYWTCRSRRATRGVCPYRELFNEEMRLCENGFYVNCGNRINPFPEYQQPDDFFPGLVIHDINAYPIPGVFGGGFTFPEGTSSYPPEGPFIDPRSAGSG